MDRREFNALALFVAAACTGRQDVSAKTTSSSSPLPMPSSRLDGHEVMTKVGFGSCYVPQFEKPEVWDAIHGVSPDAFLLLGDNVYQSEENGRPELTELRAAYHSLAADVPFANLRSSTPLFVTWDDHDYGMNDAGAEFPARLESEALFKQVWSVAETDPRSDRPGVYYSRRIGPSGKCTQIIMLDTRYFRTKDTMLGEAQWLWLARMLAQPADLRIVASSIPVLSKMATGESWSKWPDEQRRLLTLLDRTNTCVIVSGDSHFGAFYRHSEGLSAPLVELTSSSLNFPMSGKSQLAPGPKDDARLGSVFYPANFGVLHIDWENQIVDLVQYDDAGNPVRSEQSTMKRIEVE